MRFGRAKPNVEFSKGATEEGAVDEIKKLIGTYPVVLFVKGSRQVPTPSSLCAHYLQSWRSRFSSTGVAESPVQANSSVLAQQNRSYCTDAAFRGTRLPSAASPRLPSLSSTRSGPV